MNQAQYQLWMSTWNAGIKAGLSPHDALRAAIEAANAIAKFN